MSFTRDGTHAKFKNIVSKTPPVIRLQKALSKYGALRSRELQQRGFSRDQISNALSHGLIERLSRGLYSAADGDVTEHQSLLEVSKSVPNARICLLSALSFHNLTTQNPHEVWISIGPKDRRPAISNPRLRVLRFSGTALSEGLEEHQIHGVTIRVYSVAKTVVDLFRYRNKIGIDVALEALKEGWREKRFTISQLNEIARQCRMSRVMSPYLESLVA